MEPAEREHNSSFWEHLDILRHYLIKAVVAAMGCAVLCFLFKEQLFELILAPKNDDFVTYRLLQKIIAALGSDKIIEGYSVQLINTQLSGQFVTHVKASFAAGFLFASPYILYLLFKFVSPALYANERRYTLRAVGYGYAMFLIGMCVAYFVIFPLTFRFLGTYQVSAEVGNLISLHSYISTLLLILLSMGIVFEMPILCWLFARMGFLSSSYMRTYRRHAIVLLLVLAACITPTADAFTMIIVAMPMMLLYEVSIFIVAKSAKK